MAKYQMPITKSFFLLFIEIYYLKRDEAAWLDFFPIETPKEM